ncbi:hypothetical protein [Azotobacter chroococcum]|uniref:hypothetical protein n=1 Tax=Azotobacter chroococcum TaxID=353 RepID=UPI00130EA6B8|nr:hypothetical protein [Azotobacter chroococcum]
MKTNKKRVWISVSALDKLKAYHASKDDDCSFTKHIEELINDYFLLISLKDEFKKLE